MAERGFDTTALSRAIAAHGRVTRVVIAAISGSSPREVGAAMLVWDSGTEGTIGGGALEWEAIRAARTGITGLTRHPLGPALGQCCGGAVTLLTECYDTVPDGSIIARGQGEMPLAVARMLARARSQGALPAPQLVQGWMVEPAARADRQLWVWGAGHVGRAVVEVIAPLPGFAITWVDTSEDRFPEGAQNRLWADNPADLVPHAPKDAEHLVMTYSHALDLEICHRLLHHGFAFAGLIGSATKRARFLSRLAALGHDDAHRITCPIGDTALGKHPQAIAVGVAVQLMKNKNKSAETEIADEFGECGTAARGGSDQGLSRRGGQ